MGGSQLSQLKTALAGAGLSRQNSSGSSSSKNGKKKRSGVAAAKARMAGDAEARNRKLEVNHDHTLLPGKADICSSKL